MTIVDVLGNIHVHTKAGVKIPVVEQDEEGVPVSLAGKVWWFETPKVRKQLQADGDGLLLAITPNDAAKIPPNGAPFVVTDELGDERWSGTIYRRGW